MFLKGAKGQAGATPFSAVDFGETRLTSLTGWRQAELVGGDDMAVRSLFHDVAATTSGLLTNVRKGGFRGDLSLRLEKRPERSEDDYYLYEINKDPGINLEELYHYYHLHEDLEPAGSFKYTTAGPGMPASARILKIAGNPSAAVADDAHNYKMPLVIGYELLLSLTVKPLDVEFTGADGKKEKKKIQALHLVADPILTFWNPLDVPVAIPNESYVSFKYWQPPFDVDVTIDGKTGIGGRSQKQVAGDFLYGKEPLPNSRYFLDSAEDGGKLLAEWFDGTAPKDLAYRETAASLRVSGMFNVNSTSVRSLEGRSGITQGFEACRAGALG